MAAPWNDVEEGPVVVPAYQGLDIADDLLARIKGELAPDERLVWVDESRIGPKSGASGWVVALIWALACGLVSAYCLSLPIHAESGAAHGAVAPVAGLLSEIAAFLILVGMFGTWVSGLGRRGDRTPTLRALTDRRAIIRRPRIGTKAIEAHSIDRGTVRHPHRVEYPDGHGDVVFNRPTGQGWVPEIAFENVPNVRRVEDLAKQVLLNAATTPSTSN